MQHEAFDAAAYHARARALRAKFFPPRPSVAVAPPVEQRPKPAPVPALEPVAADRWQSLRDEAESQLHAANKGRVNVRQFIADFARARGFGYAAMVSDSRTQPLAMYRQDCMLALKRARPDLSYPAIGRAFGGRDHTTVMHGVRQAIRREEHEAGE